VGAGETLFESIERARADIAINHAKRGQGQHGQRDLAVGGRSPFATGLRIVTKATYTAASAQAHTRSWFL
jgi:hypothetical protein